MENTIRPEILDNSQPTSRSIQETKSRLNGLLIYIVIGVFLLVIAGSLGYIAGLRQGLSSSQTQVVISPTAEPNTFPAENVPVDIKDPNLDWGIYYLPTLNLEFQLPAQLASLGSFKEEIAPGEKGTQLCGQFVKSVSFVSQVQAGGGCVTVRNPYLLLGTTSIDYEAGRSGSFTDLQGFIFSEGKYKAKFVMGKLVDFPQELITKVENQNGVEMIRIDGYDDSEASPTMMNSLGERTGILINTGHSIYPGLAIIFEKENGLTEAEVEQVLVSFKFRK